MSLRIAILCTDGSPLGVTSKTIWGDDHRVGVGGSELALLTMCEEWTKAGDEVILFNNPWEQNASPFEQRPTAAFDCNEKYDVLIVHRTPSAKAAATKSDLVVWWSHDQATQGSFRDFAPIVDKIVVISSYHKKFFEMYYGILNAIPIPLPVRVQDYENQNVEKIPNRLLFASVPARGLAIVNRMWDMIQRRTPEAHMVITSDYRLWGCGPGDSNFRANWIGKPNYTFLGAIAREEFVKEQLKADILFYPSVYDELFCISVAEAMVAGAYPITSAIGALGETNLGEVIKVSPNDARNDITFVKALEHLLNNREILNDKRRKVREKALKLYHPETILKEWRDKVFT